MKKSEIIATESNPLKWPESWPRTLIQERRNQASWKKQFFFYAGIVEKELERMGAQSITVTRNDPAQERLDPGVAVWFALKPVQDFSWQLGLQLDSPAPTLEQIDKAFKRLSAIHHPDAVHNGSGGDPKVFYKLDDYRKAARTWVLGTGGVQDNCIPMDLFMDARQNMAGIALALKNIRGLQRLGMPTIVERIAKTAFRVKLTEGKEGKDVTPIAL